MTGPLHRRKGIAYRACFHLDIASGVFAVDFPDLPGCAGSGADFVQARDAAKHALDAWLDAATVRGEVMPAPAFSDNHRADAHSLWIAARSGFEQERALSVRRSI